VAVVLAADEQVGAGVGDLGGEVVDGEVAVGEQEHARFQAAQ
jgi:hypothetical protein